MDKYIELINNLKVLIQNEEEIKNNYYELYEQEQAKTNAIKNDMAKLNAKIKEKELHLSILNFFIKNKKKIVLISTLIGLSVTAILTLFGVGLASITSVKVTNVFFSIFLGTVAGRAWYENFTSKMREIDAENTPESLREEIYCSKEANMKNSGLLFESEKKSSEFLRKYNNCSAHLETFQNFLDIICEKFNQAKEFAQKEEEINYLYNDDIEAQEIAKLVREKSDKNHSN